MRIRIESTPSGAPTLAVCDVYIHNRFDPAREARRWAVVQQERLVAESATTAIVFGLGLGYHVEALAALWSGAIVVVEPDDALVEAARGARDLTALLARTELVADTPAAEQIAAWGRAVLCTHAPSLLRGDARLARLHDDIASRAGLRDLRLRILVISPLAGGSHPITSYCARALAHLGHAVSVLDLAPFAGGQAALPTFSPKKAARAAVGSAFQRFLGAGITAAVEAAEPDLVLAMAQAPLDPPVLEHLGRQGIVRAFWFVEDHRLFPYWKDVVGGYDYFFTIQQGALLDEAQACCAGRAAYLPLAADPTVHRPLDLTPDERATYGAPVAFVGAGYRNRRMAFRPLVECGLRIWGTEWGGSGPLERVVQRDGSRISTEDCVRIFNATTVNLNLHSSTYVDGVDPRGDFVNPRTFELAAAGAFQLVDERALLPALFRPGELTTFTETGELRDLVRTTLADPEHRAAVTAAARRRVLAEHTYVHRMQTLLATMVGRELGRWQARPRQETVAQVARSDAHTPLGRLCAELPAATPFTLGGLTHALAGREGDFSDAEAILLFLHQFDEMYVRDARQ